MKIAQLISIKSKFRYLEKIHVYKYLTMKLIVTCTIKVSGPKAKVVDYDETFIFYAAGSITRLGKKLSHAFCLLKECLSERFQTFSVVDDRIFN